MDFGEIEDKLEDAEYLGALLSNAEPRPSASFVFPSEKESKSFLAKLRANPVIDDPLSLESICSDRIGLFMFSEFLKEGESTKGESTKAQFLFETAYYRKIAPAFRLEQARKIMDVYLSALPTPLQTEVIDETLSRDITENDQVGDSGLRWQDYIEQADSHKENNSCGPLGVGGYPTEIIRVAILQAGSTSFCGIRPILMEMERKGLKKAPQLDHTHHRNSLQVFIENISMKMGPSTPPSAGRRHSLMASTNSVLYASKVGVGEGESKLQIGDQAATWPGKHQSSPPKASLGVCSETDENEGSDADGEGDEEVENKRNSRGRLLNCPPVPSVSSGRRRTSQDRGGDDTCEPTATLPAALFNTLDCLVFAYLRDTHGAAFLASPQFATHLRYMQVATRVVTLDDFSTLRVLGRGGFGLVSGCMRKTTGKLYAIKAMDKKRVKLKRSEVLCTNERELLAEVDSPFVVCLRYAFMNASSLFLILDLMSGGDLRFHLVRGGPFSPAHAKYYTVQAVLGVGALHAAGIVYRDLKPENILMSDTGETKLSDLGLAVKIPKPSHNHHHVGGTITGACGTKGYQAPEMLRRDASGKRLKYDQSVDWFSLGCCVAEFLQGYTPYHGDVIMRWAVDSGILTLEAARALDKDEYKLLYERAAEEMPPFLDPQFFDDSARDLCLRLMDRNPAMRIGSSAPSGLAGGGFREILAHPWFAGVNVTEIEGGNESPPFVPSRDINMMSQSDIGEHAEERELEKMVLSPADHACYGEWQFASKKAFKAEVVELLRFKKAQQKGGAKQITDVRSACCTVS